MMNDDANLMRDMKYRLCKHTLEHFNYVGEPLINSHVTVIVTGYELENMSGERPPHNNGEFAVGISIDGRREWFNLATLIALARTSALKAESLYGETEDAA